MRTTKQLNSLWELAREQSVEGDVLRRRVAAIGAITIGFCGFLTAIGLGVVVVVTLAAIAVSVGVAALLTAWPRLRTLVHDGHAFVRDHSRAAHGRLLRLFRIVLSTARTALVDARAHMTALAKTARAATIRLDPRVARLDPKREATSLNAIGTQHRRVGRYDEAVECHRRALEILRSVDDRRAVALTQSNLALALSHAGDDAWAIGLFEEAAATLRELGDREHEARIMANLGVTHRRHGRPEKGDDVLQLALAKLSPSSSAYQAIEAELRRAS